MHSLLEEIWLCPKFSFMSSSKKKTVKQFVYHTLTVFVLTEKPSRTNIIKDLSIIIIIVYYWDLKNKKITCFQWLGYVFVIIFGGILHYGLRIGLYVSNWTQSHIVRSIQRCTQWVSRLNQSELCNCNVEGTAILFTTHCEKGKSVRSHHQPGDTQSNARPNLCFSKFCYVLKQLYPSTSSQRRECTSIYVHPVYIL